MPAWRLRSRGIDELVVADDQFKAWDTLRERSADDFGLVVSAEPDENGDPIPVRTSALLFSWGRDEEAHCFIASAVSVYGLPDTTYIDQTWRKGE